MNAVTQPFEVQFEAMTLAGLPAVLRLEHSAYAQPWSELNFADSLKAGYQAQLLSAGEPPHNELLGYFVAMKGVDEVHLLNITVAPAYQRQGWAKVMLEALTLWARGQGAQWLWLEVRASNVRAQTVYQSHGFRQVGTRRRYYPTTASTPEREDALVMSLPL
ncbi:ribosomal-protein-alanine acetyltransferase [Polaromonas sp.]|nr:ribosomal-protein-alanine acetyltransferase [Polaromonas sp.]